MRRTESASNYKALWYASYGMQMRRNTDVMREERLLMNPGRITEAAISRGMEIIMALCRVITERWKKAYGY